MVLSFIYLGIIVFFTLYSRNTMPNYIYELTPFWSYVAIANGQYHLFYLNLLNFFMFLPLGVILCYEFSSIKIWHVTSIVAFLSLTIELLQLESKKGTFEFDDIIHNVLGGIIGVFLYKRIGKKQLECK